MKDSLVVTRPNVPAKVSSGYARDFALDRSGLRPAEPRVSVVVPAKDEAANIREILPYLGSFYEVIVVVSEDDDESAEAARTALPMAKVVYQTRKGKGNALICGFRRVTGDVIVTFDIDGSADPHEIPRFVEALVKGADLAKVVASVPVAAVRTSPRSVQRATPGSTSWRAR